MALLWSGGKDSVMASEALRLGVAPAFDVRALLTTIDEYGRVTAHGVPVGLLERQAAALGLPLRTVAVPLGAPNTVYEARVGAALWALREEGVLAVAAGDLFLEEVRRYRQGLIEAAGLRALFPLWGQPSAELAEAFVGRGFRALAVAVDASVLPRTFLGRAYDRAFLAALPPSADPCGERGEFHTFVTGGPGFRHPVTYREGAVLGETHLHLELLRD